jgi:hypothetical protein
MANNKVFTFADESEFEVPWKSMKESSGFKYLYSVGAVVVEEEDSLSKLEGLLAELRTATAHDPSIRNHPESDRLRAEGWHLTEDQISTSVPLWNFMGQTLGAKYHYRYISMSTKVSGDRLSSVYAILHAKLVRDLMLRYRTTEIHFAFEQFTDLNPKFSKIVAFTENSLDTRLAYAPVVTVMTKGESNLLALADYMILGMSRLFGANEIACSKDPSCDGRCRTNIFDPQSTLLGHMDSSSMHFRNYENIRRSVSSAEPVRLHTGLFTH